MAKIEKYMCDYEGCGRERSKNGRLRIFSHSTRDASGNGYDHWQAEADLCEEHLFGFTQYLIGRIEEKTLPKELKSLFTTFGIKFELR